MLASALLPIMVGCQRPDDSNRATAEQWVERRSRGDATSQPAAEVNSPTPTGDTSRTGEGAHAVASDGLLVNDKVVTVNDILEPIQPQIDEMAATLSEELYYRRVIDLVRQQIVDSVAHLLIYRRASETITEEMEPQVKKAVEAMERERISREFHGLETNYENHLQRKKKSRDDVKERLRRSVVVDSYLRERLLQRLAAPSRRDLAKYYSEHQADFTVTASRELYLIDIPIAAFYDREILLRQRPPMPEEELTAAQRARDEIEAAMSEIRNGERFEEVAKRRSQGPHKEDGGFWGALRSPMSGRWKAAYERFMQMKEGEVSGIIEAANSFFIVKVGRVQEATTRSFEDVQPIIVDILRNDRFYKLKSEFLQGELERSTIGSLDQFVAQIMANVPKPQSAMKPQ